MQHNALATRAPQRAESDPYYGVSPLKPPVWKKEIAMYFFLGGLSSGAYVLGRLAERFGGEEMEEIARVGSRVALAAVLPCPPLLIKDLGDPSRFHHMLRVVKLRSPMNFGAWVLTGYSGVALLGLLLEGRRNGMLKSLILDVAGIPLALTLAGYTGVLISTTATPAWSRNPWIGPVFSAGAIGSGASAIQLFTRPTPGSAANEALKKIHTAAHLAEVVTLTGYFEKAGKLARPFLEGENAKRLAIFAGGLLVSEALSRLPAPRRAPVEKPASKKSGVVAALGLLGVYALRRAFVEAGKPSASDPELARQLSRA